MRRKIDIRKRKKILKDQLNNKVVLIIGCLILFLIICLCFYVFFIQNLFIKKNLEKNNEQFSTLNESIPFSIQKIVLFSSATATSETVNQSPSLDISQYCDIAIYLSTIKENNLSIKALSIRDISISSTELGTPCLYKKRIHDFGKCSFQEDAIIEKSFEFQVIEKNNHLNENNYEIYNDGSVPLSLGFYNQNVKKGWITNESEIRYNGTLLKSAFIPQSSLQCEISFTIHIYAENNAHYVDNIYISIPFQDEKGSLYDTGYATITIEGTEISKFICIQ